MNPRPPATVFPERHLDRRRFLGGLAAAGLAAFPRPAAAAAPARPPNIVLILVDDLGWADVGCYGSRFYETPNIDRLAAQGMRFTDAYAACAVCSPTRSSIMTGRYPTRTGVTDWIRARFQAGETPRAGAAPVRYVANPGKPLLTPQTRSCLSLDEITIAEALKPAGYTSCHIGKWHLGTDEFYPEKQGFDFNIGGCDYGQPPSYTDPYQRKGQEGIPTLPPRKAGEYLTDREGDEAVGFIRAHRDKPFFLHLAHYAVHTPLEARKDLLAKYRAKTPTQQKNPVYATMVESVDQSVGRVMATLDELGLSENTLVIFTSDNGGLVGPTNNAPLRSGKGYPYEGGIRVSFIARWPGTIAAGSVSKQPITSVDLFPTFCRVAGAPLPDRPIDGFDLLPVFKHNALLKRDAIYWHFPHYRAPDVAPYSIIRDFEWKLIRRYEGKRFELFNLAADPAERQDLADQMPDKVRQLDRKLADWLAATGALLPRPNPASAPAGARKEP